MMGIALLAIVLYILAEVRADLKAERAAARAVACRKGPTVRGTPDKQAPACAGKTEGGSQNV
jgi:hypothetical protein